MLYTFKSKATGELIMMGSIGDLLLRVIGKEPSGKGIVQVPELLPAIAAIQSAIAQAESAPEPAGSEATDSAAELVTLRQRAWPLVEMMRAAQASGEAVTWGV